MLFKPKWEHKDPRVRAQAAAEIDDPRLLEVLPELAANDPDPGVRLQAAKRVTDITEIRVLAEQTEDPAVREYARRAFRSMLAGAYQPAVELATRLALLAEIDDPELLEYLARQGDEADLRRAAVERVTRPSLLGDIALEDADPQLRQLAASRIEAASTLERVADKSRTQDKRVHKIVTQCLTRLRLEAGDPAELERQAGELCLALEQLSRADETRESKQQQLERLAGKWTSLGDPPPELAARFAGARRILKAALSGSSGDLQSRRSAEIEHYLADCAAQLESTDLNVLQRSIDRGLELQRVLPDEDQAGHERLTAAVASLTESRQRLIAQQAPAPALLGLCERAEQLDIQRVREQQVRRLRSSWDAAWGAIADHRPADQSVSKRFDTAMRRLEDEMAQRAQVRKQALERLDDILGALEARLEDGDLAGAVKSKRQLLDDLAVIGSAPRVNSADFKGRVNAARGKLGELRDWQRWANNKVRVRLCEEAESIVGSGLHPDAVAEKVKAMNNQWRELEDGEHLPGDDPNRPANPGLRRRFQAACSRAFLPAKDYFKKRAQIRETHLQELDDLCAEAEAAGADEQNQDHRQLERIVARARGGLRKLGGIPPRERGAMSKRLRESAAAIDQRLATHYQLIERAKQQIIDEVTALADEPDLGKAVAAAKEAQRKWQQAGHCRRRHEQRLWTLFRGASDRVFERLNEKRSEQVAERQAQVQALGELLSTARELLKSPDLENVDGELRPLKDRWRQARCQDRRLEVEFQGLVREIQEGSERARSQRLAARKRQWQDLALACQDEEQRIVSGKQPRLEALRERWSPIADGAPEALARRVEGLLGGGPDGPAIDPEVCNENLALALELCIRMEFLAGVDTPKAYRDQRMNYQVKRLAERMSGAELPPPREEAGSIERAWLGCGPLPADQCGAVNQRFLHALQAFGDR